MSLVKNRTTNYSAFYYSHIIHIFVISICQNAFVIPFAGGVVINGFHFQERNVKKASLIDGASEIVMKFLTTLLTKETMGAQVIHTER